MNPIVDKETAGAVLAGMVPGTTYADIVQARALSTPDALAYAFLRDGEVVSRTITYGELDTRARAIAVELATTMSPGDRAMLLYPAGIDFIEAFIGCLYAGVIAVPMSPPLPARLRSAGPRLAATLRRADPRAVLTCSSSSYVRAVQTLLEDGAKLRWIETDGIANQGAARWRRPAELEPSEIAFLQFTSGSTATPKGVMVSHDNLLANTAMMLEVFEVTGSEVFCHWLPLFHDMGLIGCTLAPIRIGAPVYFMSPTDFLLRPIRWLKAMTRFRGTIAPAPNFSYDLCVRRTSEAERATLDLSSWKKALNGSEPVVEATLARFAEAFASVGFRRDSFRPCYGLAEATLLVSGISKAQEASALYVTRASVARGRVESARAHDLDVVCLPASGRSAPRSTVRVVDEATGRPCAEGEVGEIWVAGPHVAVGYWRDEATSEAVFGGRLPGISDRFLRTGDLGFLQGDRVFVSGRSKELIIQRGTNHYPHDIERTAETVEGVTAGSVAAFGVRTDDGELEQAVLLIEVQRRANNRESFESLADRVREEVTCVHGVSVLDVSLVRRGTIPRTSSGKTRRGAARDLYLANEIRRVGPIDSDTLIGISAHPSIHEEGTTL